VGLLPKNFLIPEKEATSTLTKGDIIADERRSSLVVRNRRASNYTITSKINDKNTLLTGITVPPATPLKTTSPRLSNINVPIAVNTVDQVEEKFEEFTFTSQVEESSNYDGLNDAEKLEKIMEKFETIRKKKEERVRIGKNIGTLRIAVAGDSGIGKVLSLLLIAELVDQHVFTFR
jgi:hypothetical protein